MAGAQRIDEQTVIGDGVIGIARSRLLQAFWAGVAVLVVVIAATQEIENPLVAVTGAGVIVAALIPLYVWCLGKGGTWPLFPAMSTTYVATFGLPLFHPPTLVQRYDASQQIEAGLTTIAFLLIATVAWYAISQAPIPPPQSILKIRTDVSSKTLLWLFALTSAAFALILTGVLQRTFPVGAVSLFSSLQITGANVIVALLASRLGEGRLLTSEKWSFILILILALVASVMGLTLIGAMSLLVMMFGNYTLASKRVPALAIITALVLLEILQAGKTEMRNKYWWGNSASEDISVTEYPTRLTEWFAVGVEGLTKSSATEGVSPVDPEERQATLGERASLIQMTLLAQSESPAMRPFLMGQTYSIIPSLLIPRMFWPDKPTAHEGTTVLSVYYGLQSEEATLTTTFGWGLLSESYANFGQFGVAGLGLLLGCLLGAASRWIGSNPLMSFRGLVGLLILVSAIQSEFTMAVLVTGLFQGFLGLAAIAALAMRRYPLSPSGVARVLGETKPEAPSRRDRIRTA